MKEGLSTTLSCLMIASALPGAGFGEPGLGQEFSAGKQQRKAEDESFPLWHSRGWRGHPSSLAAKGMCTSFVPNFGEVDQGSVCASRELFPCGKHPRVCGSAGNTPGGSDSAIPSPFSRGEPCTPGAGPGWCLLAKELPQSQPGTLQQLSGGWRGFGWGLEKPGIAEVIPALAGTR